MGSRWGEAPIRLAITQIDALVRPPIISIVASRHVPQLTIRFVGQFAILALEMPAWVAAQDPAAGGSVTPNTSSRAGFMSVAAPS